MPPRFLPQMKVKRFDRLRRCLLGGKTCPIVASCLSKSWMAALASHGLGSARSSPALSFRFHFSSSIALSRQGRNENSDAIFSARHKLCPSSRDTSSGEQLQGVLPHLQNFVGIRQKRR
jgi:hypothetical protein